MIKLKYRSTEEAACDYAVTNFLPFKEQGDRYGANVNDELTRSVSKRSCTKSTVGDLTQKR